MKIKKDGEVVNLTESDLRKIVKRVLNESTGVLEKQFCKNGSFNYDKYYSTECKEAENQGRESFEGCKDGKTYVTNIEVGGKTWNQYGNSASKVDWVVHEGTFGSFFGEGTFVCPKDKNKVPPEIKEDMISDINPNSDKSKKSYDQISRDAGGGSYYHPGNL